MDNTNDSTPATHVLEQGGNFTMTATCNDVGASGVTGAIAITSAGNGWAVDSNAPNGAADATDAGLSLWRVEPPVRVR